MGQTEPREADLSQPLFPVTDDPLEIVGNCNLFQISLTTLAALIKQIGRASN